MDKLWASYRDDTSEDDRSNNTAVAVAAAATASAAGASVNGGMNPPELASAEATPETVAETLIKEEPIEVQSSEEDNADDRDGNRSLKPKVSESEEEDEDEDEDDDEEEPSLKKQKTLISLAKSSIDPVTPQANGKSDADITEITPSASPPRATAKGIRKKSTKKKNSNSIWTKSTSRKGKKKVKNSNGNPNNVGNLKQAEDKVIITPVPKFPDRSDDSPDATICLSKIYKAEKVELSDDRLSAGSIKGFRMVRATRGVLEGAWYFEIKVVHLGDTGHTRLGWSTEKGDLQAPVGYDGNSFGYRDIDGSKVHKSLREKYGEEGYKEGDVIGFYINLPEGSKYAPSTARLVWYKGSRYLSGPDSKEDPPKTVPGSEISFFKNGICQGIAFENLYGGRYYPAASMYTLPDQLNCVVKFNFGPDFEIFPEDFGSRPVPRPMIEVPYHNYEGRVENGITWNQTRMCPMLKVEKNKMLDLHRC